MDASITNDKKTANIIIMEEPSESPPNNYTPAFSVPKDCLFNPKKCNKGSSSNKPIPAQNVLTIVSAQPVKNLDGECFITSFRYIQKKSGSYVGFLFFCTFLFFWYVTKKNGSYTVILFEP